MDNNFAYRPPQQANAYGPPPSNADMKANPDKYSSDSDAFSDMPQRAADAAGGFGHMSDEQSNRYQAARRAITSAQENLNANRGIVPSYNGGQRVTTPEDATNYPAW